MKKIVVLTLSAAAFLMACGPTEKPKTEDADPSAAVETIEAEEPIAESPEPEVAKELFIGSWTVDAATAGVRMDVTFNVDGSYNQKLGEVKTEGTWKKVDDTHLEMMNPNLKKPQTWELKEMTEKTLSICWNPNSHDPKTIPFQRAE